MDFSEFTIPSPQKDELLLSYLNRLASITEEKGKGHPLAWRALKSFLAFLRTYYTSEEITFIEHIFPQKMDFKENTIIRKVHEEVYPISQEMASELLLELVNACLDGRPNAQHTVAECLGFCWLCLTASRLRLPITIESLIAIKRIALRKGRYPTIEIPTLFGNRKIRVSRRLADFLDALSKTPSKNPRDTILQKPLRSLTRAFEKALQKTTFCVEFGNFTFVTLLSPPHQAGRHRYQPK